MGLKRKENFTWIFKFTLRGILVLWICSWGVLETWEKHKCRSRQQHSNAIFNIHHVQKIVVQQLCSQSESSTEETQELQCCAARWLIAAHERCNTHGLSAKMCWSMRFRRKCVIQKLQMPPKMSMYSSSGKSTCRKFRSTH